MSCPKVSTHAIAPDDAHDDVNDVPSSPVEDQHVADEHPRIYDSDAQSKIIAERMGSAANHDVGRIYEALTNYVRLIFTLDNSRTFAQNSLVAQYLGLHEKGWSWREIGDVAGKTHTAVWSFVQEHSDSLEKSGLYDIDELKVESKEALIKNIGKFDARLKELACLRKDALRHVNNYEKLLAEHVGNRHARFIRDYIFEMHGQIRN